MFRATPRPHRIIFLVGCVLLAIELTGLLILFGWKPGWAAKVCVVIATTGVGGQAGAILAGLELGFSAVQLGAVLIAFNVMHLCLFFPLITTLYHNSMRLKVIGRWVAATRREAEKQKEKVTRLGSFGLPVFVWLPFPWTGTLVGAVIGYLLGMRTSRVMLVAVPAMLLSVVTWVSAADYLRRLSEIGRYVTLGALALILVGFGVWRLVELVSSKGAE